MDEYNIVLDNKFLTLKSYSIFFCHIVSYIVSYNLISQSSSNVELGKGLLVCRYRAKIKLLFIEISSQYSSYIAPVATSGNKMRKTDKTRRLPTFVYNYRHASSCRRQHSLWNSCLRVLRVASKIICEFWVWLCIRKFLLSVSCLFAMVPWLRRSAGPVRDLLEGYFQIGSGSE